MSKYKARGPYHFIDYANGESAYHKHVKVILGLVIEHFNLLLGCRIHEVGCGEGLILQQLKNRGCNVSGNDADPEAVRMANIFLMGGVTLDSSITQRAIPSDLILFSDSLEHIKKWKDHIEWAKDSAHHILIAVPSVPDPHAVQEFKLDSFDKIMKGWKKVTSMTANKRHVLFFCE